MTTIYGHMWSHGTNEIETWRKAMMKFDITAQDMKIAANSCLEDYPDRPPTMGQVIGLVRSERPQLGSRRLGVDPFCLVKAQANRVMFAELLEWSAGLKPETLKALLRARDASVQECKAENKQEEKFAVELGTLLRGLIAGHEGEPRDTTT